MCLVDMCLTGMILFCGMGLTMIHGAVIKHIVVFDGEWFCFGCVGNGSSSHGPCFAPTHVGTNC